MVSSVLATSAWAEAGTERVGPPVSLLPPAFFGGALPVPDNRLDDLRGGFRFASGLEVHFGLAFRTQFNNETPVITTFTEADLMNHSGVINRVVDRTVTVELTNAASGLMNVIQNNLDGASISNMATLSIDLYNVTQAARTMNMGRSFDARSLLGY
ncbi:MAG: hypothetical protein QNJ30_09375 [Kiloniellales bacterium]|nr:hypothetical protein [Kiloniellales bacterium]